MKTLRNIIASVMLATASIAMADDYQYLTVSQNDGETSFKVSNIQKITFDNSDMVIQLTDGSTERLPLVSLSKMFFSEESSGIAAIGTTKSKIQFSNGMLRADIARGEAVVLYSMKGEKMFSANESGTYDLSGLTKGVYIIKVGTESRKVINK